MKKGRCHRNYRNYIAWLSSCLSWWKKSAQLEIKWQKMILSDQAWQQSPSAARGAGAFPLPLAASQKRYLCYNSYALSHSQLRSLSVAQDRVKDISFYSISCSGPTPVWPDANSWADTGDVLWAFNKNHVERTPEEEGRGRELVSLTQAASSDSQAIGCLARGVSHASERLLESQLPSWWDEKCNGLSCAKVHRGLSNVLFRL